MLFNKKKKLECAHCKKSIEKKFNFCPYCGKSTIPADELNKDFGLIGKSDEELLQNPLAAAGILSQMIAPMMQNLMKSLAQDMQNNPPEIQQLPNGISIKIGPGAAKKKYQQVKPLKPNISQDQISRMSGLPRAPAKTKIRRLSDKVIYDLEAPGVESIKDIFITKLESGYEIKAIGKNKVYMNSLSINLPLLQYSFNEDGITLEFANQ